MLNLEYIGSGSDSLVYRKGKTDKVIKFYTVNKKIPEKITVEKIKLYHSLQNLFAGKIFVLDFDANDSNLGILPQIVKSITYEILHLDERYIGDASSLNGNKNNGGLVISEVDYVSGHTLEEKGLILLGQNTAINLSQLITDRVAFIYNGTQIGSILSHYHSKEIFINPSNFKCKFKNGNLHMIITDTMNCIGLLKL